MSRNTDQTKWCTGKKQYRSFEYAEVIASRSAQRNNEPMHAYHCTRCNRFHVGSHHPIKRPQPTPEDGTHDE